jgi:hypothetical protein
MMRRRFALAVLLLATSGPLPAQAQYINSPSPDGTSFCLSMARSGGGTVVTNSCSFTVEFTFCWKSPNQSSWGTGLDCDRQSFGAASVGPNGQAGITHSSSGTLFMAACKAPRFPYNARFSGYSIVLERCN